MRFAFSACLVALLFAGVGPAQEEKDKDKDKDVRKKNEDEVKVIKLDRKTPILYEKEIEPIFVNKCISCHSGNVKEGKFDLTSYDTMMRGGKRGPVVIPSKSSESLIAKLSQKHIRPFMPPRSEEALSPQELALLKLWIDQGAKAPSGIREPLKVVLKVPNANVNPVLGVAVSPDKSQVAATRGNQIHVYDASSGNHVRTLLDGKLEGHDKKAVKAAHLSLVESLAFSPDGKYLASGSYQEVKLWDAKTGELRQTVKGFAERVVTLAFSYNSKMLATGGGAPTQEGELKILNVADGKVLINVTTQVHSDTVFGVAFSPDDKQLVSCGADKFVKIFEVPSGKFVKSFEGHTHHVMGVGFSGDGKLIASGGADNVVKIWNVETGEQARSINAHQKQVTALVFIGKSQNFITCSGDTSMKRWNTNGGDGRAFAGGNDFQYSVASSPDGAVIVGGGQDGIVRLYNAASGALIKAMTPPGADTVAPKKDKSKTKDKDKK